MYQVIIALQQMRENFKSIAIVTAGGCLINKMCWYMCIFFLNAKAISNLLIVKNTCKKTAERDLIQQYF